MLKKFFILLNILALAVLLLSCMAVYIDPNTFWQISFIGFAFPVVLIANVLFLVLWMIVRSKFAFVPLAAIVLSWGFIRSSFAINFSSNDEKGIKLMCWNTKNFDLYNWNRNGETREKMMNLIQEEQPDVLCLQEFYTNNQVFANVEYLRDTLGYAYSYFPPSVEIVKAAKTKGQKKIWRQGMLDQKWGVAIFSKHPIVDTGKIDFENSLNNDCIYADVNMDGRAVRIYNVHFQSLHLGYEDYATLDEIEHTRQTRWVKLKSILRKMKRAYTKRALQSEAVAEHMKGAQNPTILCGDFNDIPVSYSYNTVAEDLNDAFVKKGNGFGATFVSKFSIFRIDHVLCHPDMEINSYKIIKQPLSDHYPICVTFSL